MNKLESIFEIKNHKKTALLIDAHNLIFRCVFVANKQDPLDEEFIYWKFLIINNILKIPYLSSDFLNLMIKLDISQCLIYN